MGTSAHWLHDVGNPVTNNRDAHNDGSQHHTDSSFTDHSNHSNHSTEMDNSQHDVGCLVV